MALPTSTWFWSRRWVVGPLSGKSAAALMMSSRVQVLWSSQSLRMAWRKASSFAVGFWSDRIECAAERAESEFSAAAWRLNEISNPMTKDTVICRLMCTSF